MSLKWAWVNIKHQRTKIQLLLLTSLCCINCGANLSCTNKEAEAAASLLLYRSAQSAGIVVYHLMIGDVKIWKICKQKSNRSMMWKISGSQPNVTSAAICYVYHWTKHIDVLVFQCRIIYEGGGVDESPWMELTKTHRLHHMVPCNIILFHVDTW